MIALKDFQIKVGRSEKGVFVRVCHAPTGNELLVDPVSGEPVGHVVQRLIKDLAGRVFDPEDFVTHHIRARPKGFMRVVHVPSGSIGTRTARKPQES